MPRQLKEAQTTTANARSKLPPGLYWRRVDVDIHLGYRKKTRDAGTWVVRWYMGDQKYWHNEFAKVEGVQETDRYLCLDYYDAVKAAVAMVDGQKAKVLAKAFGPPVTVRSALEAYATAKEFEHTNQGNARKGDARQQLTKHVLANEDLAKTPLYELSEGALIEWKANLGTSPSTTQRITGSFKAALNAAVKAHRATLPRDLAIIIKNGLGTEKAAAPIARHGQALSDEVIRQIVVAAKEVDAEDDWDGDLYRLIAGLAASGGRFSQLTRMTVGDFQQHYGRIMVPVSRKGRAVKSKTHVAFPFKKDMLSILRPITEGRGPTEILFERWYSIEGPRMDGERKWVRVSRGRWKTASQLAAPWKKIVTRAGLDEGVIPYALRHSSIVRMLRQHIPVELVAALHDTSAQTIRRHYAAEIVDALSEMASLAAFDLSPGG
jgi:integrase